MNLKPSSVTPTTSSSFEKITATGECASLVIYNAMDSPEAAISRRQNVEALVMLSALVLIAYANCFSSGFVVDGRPLILESERVHSITFHNLKEILLHSYTWPAFDSGLYRPLTTLSYLVNYVVLGDANRPVGYHWFNLLAHAANAFLVYLLALRLARRYWPAFFAAALWALHPVCTEAVTYIAGRPEELAALGVLGALVLYVYKEAFEGKWKVVHRVGMMTAAAVAVFSKESGVVMLALAVFFDFVYRSRWPCAWRGLIRRDYGWLALPVLVMLCLRWLALRHDGAMEIQFVDNPISDAGFFQGRLTAVGVIGRYFGVLAWPGEQSCDYSFNQVPLFDWRLGAWQQWIPMAVAVLLFLGAFYCRRSRTGFFLFGFSTIALLPASNLLVITGTIMAERLLYLPSVGFAIAVSLGIHKVAARLGLGRMAPMAALGVIAVAYGTRTYLRNPDWRDGETLYVSAAGAVPYAVRPHLSLARDWFTLDPDFLQGERAIREAEAAENIVAGLPARDMPSVIPATLARLCLARGDLVASRDRDGNPHADTASAKWYREALEAALQAVAADRAFDASHRRREMARGRPSHEIPPDGNPEVYATMGRVCLRLGEPQAALEAFLYLPKLVPVAPLTYSLIASAYQAQNKMADGAQSLLESYLLDDSQETLSRVVRLYGRIEGGNCAVTDKAGSLSLNRDCPVVQRDLCNGYRELEKAALEARQFGPAERFHELSGSMRGCH
jgi:hypothetical protein